MLILMRAGLGLGLAVLAARATAQPVTEDQLTHAGETAARPDAVLRYGPDDVRRGELRLPSGRGPHPVAVLIHGGCWRADIGGRGHMRPLADALVRRGFATWNIDYRLIGQPGAGWPGTFEDVGAGVDYVRTLARRYRLDLSQVVVIGHSAGAHLALWAASRPRLHDPVAGRHPLRPAAVVAIDGPGTLAPFVGLDAAVCGQPVIAPLMGGTPAERPAAYRLASPQEHLPLGVRTLLVLAELGPLMQPYLAAARAAHEDVDFLTPPQADHFNIMLPGTRQGDLVAGWIADSALPPPATPTITVSGSGSLSRRSPTPSRRPAG